MSRLRGRWVLVVALGILSGCERCARGPSPESVGQPRIDPAAEHENVVASPASSAGSDTAAKEITWAYDRSPVGPMRVVTWVPPRSSPDAKLPVLVALHGRGEAAKGPELGARGWVDDYWLPKADARLREPPLRRDDFLGMVTDEHLARLNASLEQRPFRGVVVVAPFTPDILAGDRDFAMADPFTRFVVDDLLPRAYRETPAIGDAKSTGIDGVSLGGRAAMLVGLGRPQAFGVVATLQPAFSPSETAEVALLGRRALAEKPALRVRLLTSREDYFLASTRKLATELEQAGVATRLDVVEGDHSYEFNRGPGVYEMLLFHDRALRGEPYLD